jgi:hypothetical protein
MIRQSHLASSVDVVYVFAANQVDLHYAFSSSFSTFLQLFSANSSMHSPPSCSFEAVYDLELRQLEG